MPVKKKTTPKKKTPSTAKKKTTATPKKKPTTQLNDVVVEEELKDQLASWANRIVGHENVDPTTLIKHDANWRLHPVMQQERMRGVLDDLGWLDELMVNKTTGKILNGHMRLDLALEQGEPSVPVRYVELTEQEELKALATFDIIGMMAAQDTRKLNALRAANSEAVEKLQSNPTSSSEAVSSLLQKGPQVQKVAQRAVERLLKKDEEADKRDDSLEAVSPELPGAIELKPMVKWEYGLSPYDIPHLLLDKLIACPQPILTWTAPDSHIPSEYYLTILGNGNLFGLPFDKTILCCHTNDDPLERMWADPLGYAKRLLNRGYLGLMTPEYSVGREWSMAERIFNTFRNRYIGYYWQTAGMNVIPSVSHVEVEGDEEFLYAGIPEGVPCISFQTHSHYPEEDMDDRMERLSASFNTAIDIIKPQSIIVYGDAHRDEYIDYAGLRDHKTLEVISIEDFATARNRFLKERRAKIDKQ